VPEYHSLYSDVATEILLTVTVYLIAVTGPALIGICICFSWRMHKEIKKFSRAEAMKGKI
jgi:hypothetical protein